jgi:hypothetical protein
MSDGAGLGDNHHGSCSFAGHLTLFSQFSRNRLGVDALQRSKPLDAHKSCFELS